MEKRAYSHYRDFLYIERRTLRLKRTVKRESGGRRDWPLPRPYKGFSTKSRSPPSGLNYRPAPDDEEAEAKEKLDEIRAFSSYNELIVYLLDNHSFVKNFFHVPIIEENRLSMFQAFEEENTSIGTYENLLHEAAAQGIDKEILDSGLNIFEAQKFAILQLLIKAEDTHGGNIIIQVNSQNQLVPIPIDFGRCLSHNPADEFMLPRTTKWEQWPALLFPTDMRIVELFENLPISRMMTMIRIKFLQALSTSFSPEEIKLFENKFFHLEANLLMLREAIRMGLTIKKMVALIVPIVDERAFEYITQGVVQGGELWPARERFAQLETAFIRAWKRANLHPFFNRIEFGKAISEEILLMSKIPDHIIEERYFSEISYQLRKGLFL